MNNDWDEYVLIRSEKELQKNTEYVNLQKRLAEAYKHNDLDAYSELTIKMQIIIVKTCYKSAIKEMICITAD